MKRDQLIEYKKWNNFLQKLYTKWGRETNSIPIFVSIVLNLAYSKNKLHQTLEYWSREIDLIFNFSEKRVRLVSPPRYMYDSHVVFY